MRRMSARSERLVGLVHRFPRRRIIVLGDLVADEFVHGDIARVSREAPVLILEHRHTVCVPGGAGNAVANLRALGAHPLPVGLVGRDAAGILTLAGYETPAKSRIVAGGVHTRRQQLVRIDRGERRGELPARAAGALDRRLRKLLPSADGVLIADYGYGAATPERASRALTARQRQSLPLFVDSRGAVSRYRRATACTPNQEELERALGLEPLATLPAVERAARGLLEATGNAAVLVTRGASGMSLFARGTRALHLPAFGSDEVADVTGAGDTVIAVFALARLSGADFADAARLANYAAGLVVMKAGTATVTPAELVAAIEGDR
jgi:rfaE bifunctional protein kinase chain/domain